jgi:hypothetical protein
MSEHDESSDGSELDELRELHRQDRMPAEVRRRLVWRWRSPNARADALDGSAGAERETGFDAGPPDPGLPNAGRARRERPRLRPVAYALAASALMAAAALIAVGRTGSHLGVERELVTLDPEAPRTTNTRAKPSGDPNQAEMRVVGWLIPNSLRRMPSTTDPWMPCRYGFQLSPLMTASNAILRIEYAQCGLPSAMVGSAGCVKITADGYIEEDGHVEASRVSAEEVHCQP